MKKWVVFFVTMAALNIYVLSESLPEIPDADVQHIRWTYCKGDFRLVIKNGKPVWQELKSCVENGIWVRRWFDLGVK